MQANDRIVVDLADQSGFLAVMSAAMLVIFDACGEPECKANGIEGQHAIEIHPLAAVLRPGRTAKGFPMARRCDRSLKFDQMLARHC